MGEMLGGGLLIGPGVVHRSVTPTSAVLSSSDSRSHNHLFCVLPAVAAGRTSTFLSSLEKYTYPKIWKTRDFTEDFIVNKEE